MFRYVALLLVCVFASSHAVVGERPAADVFVVDPARGDDRAAGTREKPLRSISAALEKLAEPLERPVSILLATGRHTTTGGHGMPEGCLHLARRMRPDVAVLIGPLDEKATPPVLAWGGGDAMVDAREGSWRIEHVQVGAGETNQRRGVVASGTAEVVLRNVRMSLRSNSDAGILARRGGRILLRGGIRLNDPPPQGDETFSAVIATDHGVVEFDERAGASLELGNGNLQASYYGSIRLGCEGASITSRTRSNCLSIGNGGRIDLRNTLTRLVATDPKNTPIGLEDDGHVLAEDAHIVITGENDSAIALQKASCLYCNDVELQGKFGFALWASSGSVFVGAFTGDVGRIEARTGASICLEKVTGKEIGPVEARSGGTVALPDRTVR